MCVIDLCANCIVFLYKKNFYTSVRELTIGTRSGSAREQDIGFIAANCYKQIYATIVLPYHYYLDHYRRAVSGSPREGASGCTTVSRQWGVLFVGAFSASARRTIYCTYNNIYSDVCSRCCARCSLTVLVNPRKHASTYTHIVIIIRTHPHTCAT